MKRLSCDICVDRAVFYLSDINGSVSRGCCLKHALVSLFGYFPTDGEVRDRLRGVAI